MLHYHKFKTAFNNKNVEILTVKILKNPTSNACLIKIFFKRSFFVDKYKYILQLNKAKEKHHYWNL